MNQVHISSALPAVWQVLSFRRRLQLFGLLSLMIIGGLSEFVSIGAVIPLLTLLAAPDTGINDAPYAQLLFES